MNRKEFAVELHGKGYNCSQSVGGAFYDMTCLDESEMFRVMTGFGLGMGGMKGTCGAVSAGVAVIGLLMNNGDTNDVKQKIAIHKAAKEYTERFAKKNTSIVCGDLKGVHTGVKLRSCDGCIEDAVAILENMIEEGIIK